MRNPIEKNGVENTLSSMMQRDKNPMEGTEVIYFIAESKQTLSISKKYLAFIENLCISVQVSFKWKVIFKRVTYIKCI